MMSTEVARYGISPYAINAVMSFSKGQELGGSFMNIISVTKRVMNECYLSLHILELAGTDPVAMHLRHCLGDEAPGQERSQPRSGSREV